MSSRKYLPTSAEVAQAAIVKAIEDAWIQGFGFALAEINRNYYDCVVPSNEAVQAAGLDFEKFKASGLDPYDLKVLRKTFARKPIK
jgi:hypothetical protein